MYRHLIHATFMLAAVLLGVVILATPVAAGAGTGQPQFYTDEFHFQFENSDLTAICGFPVSQTINGYVRGFDRVDASGAIIGGSVQVTVTGTYSSDQATVPFRAKTRNIDTLNPDGSDTGVVTGILALVVVPGQGAVEVVAGRLEVRFPAGGGPPTVVIRQGQDTENAFFGSVGNPGTLCGLLAS